MLLLHRLLLVCSVLLLLGGCANNDNVVQGVSSALFAAGGAYGGYQACKKGKGYERAGCATLGGIAGAIIGNFVGSEIIHYMDNSDKQRLNQALNQRSPQAQQWRNPQTGTAFRVSDIRRQNNCRTFTLQATNSRQQRISERHQACSSNGSYI